MKIAKVLVGPAVLVSLVAGVAHAGPGAAASGDAARGKTLFQQRCAMCHSVGQKGSAVGPNLAGVVGRKAGSAAKFNYSPAMKKSGMVWNAATLDAYLASPMSKVPGGRMAVSIPKADDRRDIIAYLDGVK